ncbi:MAG: YfcE family phosphodiesterase [bacterium]|nr:YfcE family phosphodiesterase [bacterium]
MTAVKRYGIISDTHGAVHARISEIFHGVEAILHGGDVVGGEVLRALETIAPVYAVAGNCDAPGETLPLTRVVALPFGRAGLAHGHRYSQSKETRHREMLRDFERDGVRLIVTGHSHQQHLEFMKNAFIVNPGAASRPRFNLQSSVCVMEWNESTDLLRFDFIPLKW